MITLNDLKGIDTHEIEVRQGEYDLEAETTDLKIWIEKRRLDCDRGRYGFWVESKDQNKMTIDFADCFPRYFFSLQRAFDELNDYLVFNKQLNGQSTESTNEKPGLEEKTEETKPDQEGS